MDLAQLCNAGTHLQYVPQLDAMALTHDRAEVRVGPQGRIVIPAELRRVLGIQPGEVMVARVEEDRLVLERRQGILCRLKARFAAAVPRDVSLVDELLAERRKEVRRESAE